MQKKKLQVYIHIHIYDIIIYITSLTQFSEIFDRPIKIVGINQNKSQQKETCS